MDRNKKEQKETAPFPSFRVWLCGPFRVERLVSMEGLVPLYEAVRTAEWGGSRSPRLLLKALLCLPRRQARRETLLELLWPDTDPEQAAECLNTATSKLRNVLMPPREQECLLITESDPVWYRLAGQDSLWTDMEAALAALDEAERTENALSLLEQIETYLGRGGLLEEEEGSWVSSQRAMIERARYRSRLRLAEAYRQEKRWGKAEATLSLLLEEDPTDEDVICRLMELFHQQWMTHQALRLYKQTCQLLEEEGLEPTAALKDLAERLRSEKQRPVLSLISSSSMGLPALRESRKVQRELLDHRSTEGSALFSSFFSSQTVKLAPGQELEDLATNTIPRHAPQQALSLTTTTPLIPSHGQLFLLWERLSQALARPSSIDETTLQFLETHTEQYWQARQRAAAASCDLLSYVWDHLQKVTLLLEGSLLPMIRMRLCSIAGKTAQLVGELLLDMGNYEQARRFHEASIVAAQEAHNRTLEAIAWGRTSLAWVYCDNIQEALNYIQEARRLIAEISVLPVSTWLAAIEAEIQARQLHSVACIEALEDAEHIEDQHYPFEDRYLIHFDRSLLRGYQGTCFRHLYRPEDPQSVTFLSKAQHVLKEALASLDPTLIQRQPTFLTDLADTYIQQGEIEEACKRVTQAASMATQIKLQKVIVRLLKLRQELEPWKDTQHVKTLDNYLVPLLMPEAKY